MVTFAAATKNTASFPTRAPAQHRVSHFVAITCSVPSESHDLLKADCRTHAQLVSPSRDPIGYDDGLNIFQYVRSNPTVYLDASGESIIHIGGAAIIALFSCAYPQYLAAMARYEEPEFDDKLRHCWVSCRIAKSCGPIAAEFAGASKEARDRAIALVCIANPKLSICDGGHGDFWDSITDLAANHKCSGYPEQYVIGWGSCIGGWASWIVRESCEDCCKRKWW